MWKFLWESWSTLPYSFVICYAFVALLVSEINLRVYKKNFSRLLPVHSIWNTSTLTPMHCDQNSSTFDHISSAKLLTRFCLIGNNYLKCLEQMFVFVITGKLVVFCGKLKINNFSAISITFIPMSCTVNSPIKYWTYWSQSWRFGFIFGQLVQSRKQKARRK